MPTSLHTKTCLAGLDVGTTGCKAILFDRKGKILGRGFYEYGVDCTSPGMAEQDPEEVWRLCRKALRDAVAQAKTKAITALSISVQGDAIIPLDAGLRTLHPAILGMDYRSAPQAAKIEKTLGGFSLFQTTGMRPHPMNSAVKAVWLREQAPRVFLQTRHLVTYAEFIMARLGGDLLIDHSMASRTMAFNFEARAWDESLLSAMGLNPLLFSRAVPSGTDAGVMDRRLSRELGIMPGTLLVTGGHDQACAALGCGAIREGLGVISTGTAQVLSTSINRPALSRRMFESFYPCYHHAAEGRYLTFALLHVGGILLRWYRENFAQAEAAQAARSGKSVYQFIDRAISDGPSPLFVIPHWNGSGTPHCDLQAKGAILGLTLASTRHDVAKAILEGLTFELFENISVLRSCGIRINHLVAAGGGTKSELWLQLKADILNRPIRTLRCGEAACLGAAMLAGLRSGVYPSLQDAIQNTVVPRREFEPRPEMARRYAERFALYRKLYPALRPLNAVL